MLAKRPSLWSVFFSGAGLIFCCAVWQQLIPGVPIWLAVIGMLFVGLMSLVTLLAIYDYLTASISYARAMWQLAHPDVRIAEAHVELARQVRGMSVTDKDMLRQILNAMQRPTQFEAGDEIVVAGRAVKMSSVLEYLGHMQPDGSMPQERNYTREPARGDIRHIADTIEDGYAVEAASNRGSVKTSKELLHKMVEEKIT